MPKKPPQRDPSAAYVRKTIAARRTGNRKCACSESRPEALIPDNEPISCYACQRKKEGKIVEDDHHPAAEANDSTTIPVPVNDHRANLSVAQYDWPKRTLENPDGSPLLARAACIRGFVDTNYYLMVKLLLPGPEFYELLDALLTEKFGPKWWTRTELEKFAPKR
jgi:hypothetical protein